MISFLQSFKTDFGVIIISALIFVVSFLWKDLLNDIEEMYFPKNKGIAGRVIYILTITCIILLCVVMIRRTIGLENPQFDDTPTDIPDDGE